MRRLAAVLGLLAGLLGFGLALAAPAFAHASVVGSDPVDGSRLKTAPAKVTITFDEDVGLGGIGYLHVTNASGQRVDAGAAFHPGGNGTEVTDTLKKGLGDGSYTESYRVVSADSHPVAGTIAFVVGHGALVHGTTSTSASNGTTATAFDVSRWISYAGLALLGGTWLLLTVWPEGRDDPRAAGLGWSGVGLTALGGVLELLLQGPYAAGDGPGRLVDGGLLDDTLHTTYGQLHSVRLVLIGLLALALVRMLRFGSYALPRWLPGAMGVLAVGVAATFSAAGHADTTSPNWLSIPLDVLHLLAMGAWLGGLIVLLAAVLPRRDPGELGAVLPVFSKVAFTSVVVLASTGTYAAWRGVGTVNALFTTSYGLLVAGKVVLFVGLVLLGNLSRGVVQRRFARPVVAYAMTDAALQEEIELDDEDDGVQVEVERLRRAVYVEVLVGLLVLALTAILVAQPRGKEALVAQYRRPVTVSAPLGGDRSVVVTSDSGTHGTLDLTFTIADAARGTKLVATATQQQAQIGPVPITLSSAGTGSYSGTANLPVAGSWDLDITVTTSVFDATTTDATLHLH